MVTKPAIAPLKGCTAELRTEQLMGRDAPAHQTLPRKGYTRNMPGHQPPQNTVKPMLCARSCGLRKGHLQTTNRTVTQIGCRPAQVSAQ